MMLLQQAAAQEYHDTREKARMTVKTDRLELQNPSEL